MDPSATIEGSTSMACLIRRLPPWVTLLLVGGVGFLTSTTVEIGVFGGFNVAFSPLFRGEDQRGAYTA